jgi:hypothetical protein
LESVILVKFWGGFLEGVERKKNVSNCSFTSELKNVGHVFDLHFHMNYILGGDIDIAFWFNNEAPNIFPIKKIMVKFLFETKVTTQVIDFFCILIASICFKRSRYERQNMCFKLWKWIMCSNVLFHWSYVVNVFHMLIFHPFSMPSSTLLFCIIWTCQWTLKHSQQSRFLFKCINTWCENKINCHCTIT